MISVLASGSDGNCYHVTTDGAAPLLIECGIRYAEIQHGIGFEVSGLAGCLVSHEHQDHCRAIDKLLAAGVDLYASGGTLRELAINGHHCAHQVQALRSVRIGPWLVLPFPTVHDAAEPLGFLVVSPGQDKILYATDTHYVPHRFRGVTHMMLECNYDPQLLLDAVAAGAVEPETARRIRQSHMSVDTLVAFLRANDLSKLEEIHLLHLSDGNSDAERFRREVMAVAGVPVYVAGGGVSSESHGRDYQHRTRGVRAGKRDRCRA